MPVTRAQDGQDPPRRTREPGGSWLLSRCRLLTDVKQRETLTHPSPSMTAMGGEDDAVDSSAWLAPSVPCSAFRPETLLEQPSTRAGGFPLGPLAGAARSSLPASHTRSGRGVAGPQALQQQPNNHQTAVNPLGSKRESDPPGRRHGQTAVDRLGAGARVGGDQSDPIRRARPGRPTCGLPAACAPNPLSAQGVGLSWR